MSSRKSPQAKIWDFTINNPTESDEATVRSWTESTTKLIVAREIAPTTGTVHLQGRCHFNRNYSIKSLHKLFPKAHWEKTICWQDDLYFRKAESEILIDWQPKKKGQRTDIDEFKADVKAGMKDSDLWDKHTSLMIRCPTGTKAFIRQARPSGTKSEFREPRWPLQTDFSKSIVLWGSTGIGKTEYALQHFNNALFVTQKDALKRFNPEQHDGIVFDDMNFSHLHREEQIHITDMTKSRDLHCRNDDAVIPAYTRKIFTTNNPGGAIFELDDPAIRRRLNIVHLEIPESDR